MPAIDGAELSIGPMTPCRATAATGQEAESSGLGDPGVTLSEILPLEDRPSANDLDGRRRTLVTRGPLSRRSDVRRGTAEQEVQDKTSSAHGAPGVPPLDDATVELAKRGNRASWEAAYLAYGRALMGYLVLRLDNRDDAAEALSETFTRAIDKASSFRGDAYAFRAWLFSIARNVSTDQQRFRSRLVLLAEQPERDNRHEPSGEDLAILEEDRLGVRRAFAKLTQAEREILWLRVCAGLPAAEVGQVLRKKPGTVRMQQLRALQALRVQVGS